MRHLAHLADYCAITNMHTKNLAIVWAPNLLRYLVFSFDQNAHVAFFSWDDFIFYFQKAGRVIHLKKCLYKQYIKGCISVFLPNWAQSLSCLRGGVELNTHKGCIFSWSHHSVSAHVFGKKLGNRWEKREEYVLALRKTIHLNTLLEDNVPFHSLYLWSYGQRLLMLLCSYHLSPPPVLIHCMNNEVLDV